MPAGLAARDRPRPVGRFCRGRAGRHQHRSAGRHQPGSRPALAVLAGGRRPRFRISSFEAENATAETGYAQRRRGWYDAPVSDIIDDLSWRGLIAVSTDLDDLRKALDTGIVTFYCGFDPTAPGLHIGN